MTGRLSRFDPRPRLAAFLQGEGGTAIVEGVVWLPVLLFGWLTVFGFWDVYRERATVQKATYVAADLLSREMVPVDTAYLDGLGRLIDGLSDANMTVTKRYTVYRRTGEDDTDLSVLWSYAPNDGPTRNTAQVREMVAALPKIRQGETAILVETSATYAKTLTRPFESLVLGGTMDTRVVLRPRFFPAVCLNAASC